MLKRICILLFVVNNINAQPNILDSLLKNNAQLKAYYEQTKELNIQIVYTQINRDKHNIPTFNTFTYNTKNHPYFYPASTVKMPIALLALEKLNDKKYKAININTPLIESTQYNALPKNQNTYTKYKDSTVANYIKQIFLVSDNHASNVLYQFCGQAYIQQKLREKNYKTAIIKHQLGVNASNTANKQSPAFYFIDSTNNIVFTEKEKFSTASFTKRKVSLGKAYLHNGQIINKPFDFSDKNNVRLIDLHRMLQSVIFPANSISKSTFTLTPAQRKFVLYYMSAYPGESMNPLYDTSNYYDAYCKFLLYGAEKKPTNPNIRIFNKVGDAYGFLTDIAYIVDFENKVEFLLSATINCNTNKIYNDDNYDYETIGFPFLKFLGEAIYNYELKRAKKYLPYLQEFIMNYQQPL